MTDPSSRSNRALWTPQSSIHWQRKRVPIPTGRGKAVRGRTTSCQLFDPPPLGIGSRTRCVLSGLSHVSSYRVVSAKLGASEMTIPFGHVSSPLLVLNRKDLPYDCLNPPGHVSLASVIIDGVGQLQILKMC